MKISKSMVTKITLTEVDGLDPVNMFLEDYKPGQGKLTLECFGDSWSHYWGSMGEGDLLAFLRGANTDYIASKLFPSAMDRQVVDYEKISSEIGADVDEHSLLGEEDKVAAAYGEDWQFHLPKKRSHHYEYLLRIVESVKCAVGLLSAEEPGVA